MRVKAANSAAQSAFDQSLPSKWPQPWLAISCPSCRALQISPSRSATSSFDPPKPTFERPARCDGPW
jgi:hypothetical protein